MQRLPIESSDVVAVGYDPKTRTLEVEFNGGRIYRYREVEAQIHEHFIKADSPGRYFNSYINNQYRYERVDAKSDTEPQAKGGAIVFATGNARKVRDLQQACAPYGIGIEQLDLPIDEVQNHDPAYVARKKAEHAYKLARRSVLVNDVFWNILALRGFPGAYMKDMVGWLKAEDFLRLMEGKSERSIIGSDTIVYYDGSRHKAFVQTYTGTIIREPRGQGRVSVDQIIVMAGQTKTIAELEDSETRSAVDPLAETSAYNMAAKWLHMQRRLGRA